MKKVTVQCLEIAGKSEFNLNIPRYIDSSEPEDIHDLNARLNGGIPNRDIDALQNYWDVFPSLRKTLFDVGIGPFETQLARIV